MADDAPMYNNISPIRQNSGLDFDNLGLTSSSSRSSSGGSTRGSPRGDGSGASSSSRRFTKGNHTNSVVTKEGITIIVAKGNIAEQMVEGVVNSVGGDFDMSKGALAKSILTKAGPEIQKELLAKRPRDLHYGDVIVTRGHWMSAKFVFHGSLKGWKDGKDDAEQVLRTFAGKVLTEAAKIRIGSLAFPAVGSGILGFPADIVATCLFDVVDGFSARNAGTSVSEVRFVIHAEDAKTFAAFEQKLSKLAGGPAGGVAAAAAAVVHNSFDNLDDSDSDFANSFDHSDSVDMVTPAQPIGVPGVPSSWMPQNPYDPYRRVELKSSDAEYQAVERNVRSSCRNTLKKIVKIERIENYILYQQFVVAKNCMTQTCERGTKVERQLWHGTSKEALNNIYAGGFNRSYCGKNATYYGKGAYFARDFSYSADPSYSPADETGHRYIFQCLALTGHYTVGKSDMIEPPIRTGKLRYDSVTNNVNDPAIFVIFKDTHVYPEYLVTFM